MKSVLIIPTLNIELAKRCALSFTKGLVETNITIIIIHNGSDDYVESSFCNPYIILGSKDSDRLAKEFAKTANCQTELLFGDRSYGRSFGGASNLALAIAYCMDADIILKIDDDCLDINLTVLSWLQSICQSTRSIGIKYGAYSGQDSGGVHRLPRRIGMQLAEFIYSKDETKERMDGKQDVDKVVIKNGCIVFDKKSLGHTCYPVLYERKSNISARGEVYLLKQELNTSGVSLCFDDALVIHHSPLEEKQIQSWLSAMVVGFDINYVRRCIYEEVRGKPRVEERQNKIQCFQEWIRNTEWPNGVDGFMLEELLTIVGQGFADRIIDETPVRHAAWQRFIRKNPGGFVKDLLQEITN